jgi:hypothetical protein
LEFYEIIWLIFMDGLGAVVEVELIPGIEATRIELHSSVEKPYIILILNKFILGESGGMKLGSDQAVV